MFTGIIEETGRVAALSPEPGSERLQVASQLVAADVRRGDSVAVNGCCLTVAEISPGSLGFDLLEETRRLTSFAQLAPGSLVNLERSLRADSRLGGHVVSGHVDAPGRIEVMEARGKDHYLRVTIPSGFARYLVYKGSVAIDGVSLTVAEVTESSFAVWLIPHTLAGTNLRERKAGDTVNLEFDLLAKYVEKITAARPA